MSEKLVYTDSSRRQWVIGENMMLGLERTVLADFMQIKNGKPSGTIVRAVRREDVWYLTNPRKAEGIQLKPTSKTNEI